MPSQSAKILLQASKFRDATALAYYAMYHTLISLLFRVGIKCENHIAAIQLLHEIFGTDTHSITKARKRRLDTQYKTDSIVTMDDAKTLIIRAEEFTTELRHFNSSLTEEDVIEYRKKAMRLLGK